MSFSRNFILFFVLILFSSGCGSLKSLSYSSEQNKSIHIRSCGPEALYNALTSLKKTGSDIKIITKKEISREIKKDNKLSAISRGIASAFVYEARAITFPCEITNFLEKREITIKKINNLKDLKDKDTAVVLINKKDTMHYHWITHPTNYNILNFFGKDTVVCRIYLLQK